MQRTIKVAMSFSEYTTRMGVTKIIKLDFHDEIIQRWCLELCLLEEELVDTVTLVAETGSFKLAIAKDASISRSDRGKVEWNEKGAKVRLSLNELEVWTYFYLKYYLNSIGDVNHLDTEIRSDGKSPALDLMLTVPLAAPPLPGEELNRRLGLS